jgi:hypothetical protein
VIGSVVKTCQEWVCLRFTRSVDLAQFAKEQEDDEVASDDCWLDVHQCEVEGPTFQLTLHSIYEYVHEGGMHVATISYATEKQ